MNWWVISTLFGGIFGVILSFLPTWVYLPSCLERGGVTYAAPPRESPSLEEASRISAEAFWGQPFGVARVSLVVPLQSWPLGPEGLVVSEAKGRVFYPAVQEGPIRAFLRETTGLSGGRLTLYFLFTGQEPLEVHLRSPADTWTLRLVPGEHPRRRARLLTDWLDSFRPRTHSSENDLFYWKAYLHTMLARRLGLSSTDDSQKKEKRENFHRFRNTPEPESRRERPSSSESSGFVLQDQPGRSQNFSSPAGSEASSPWSFPGVDWEPLLASQSLAWEMFQERIEGRSRQWRQPMEYLLPESIRGPSGELEKLTEPPSIEPLASRVPEECFYIRFGSMAHFAWFRELLDWASRQWNLVVGKGVDYELVRRSEEQLCLRSTGWNRWLGPQWGGQVENLAVADVAMIGLDLFQRDGSGLGVLFQARSEELLRANIQRQRAEAIRMGQGKVHEQKLSIEGREVSLLTSEDGRIRSFYVADGPWHLVSTSHRLIERFLQTRSGQGSLAGAADFRRIRAKYPPHPKQTAFWYFPEAFWRNLVSPAYQVEMRRRAQAEADLLLVELARQAALSEGRPADSIETLVSQGFLPPEFGPRSDGSQVVLKDGQAWDSLRGRSGYFTPIADLPVARVTAVELQQVEASLRAASSGGNRLGPLAWVFYRSEGEKGAEKVDMEIYAYNLPSTVLDTLGRFLGPASREQVVPLPGDVAFVEWRLPLGRVFFGLRADEPAEVRLGRGKLLLELVPPEGQLLLQALRVGYVGREGETPFLAMLDRLLGGRPDPEGYTGKPGGLWRRQIGAFVLYSFQRNILAEVGDQVRLQQARQAAQVRLSIKDPRTSHFGQWLHPLAYQYAQRTCLANLRLLAMVENQFHLSGEAALETVQQWLRGRLVCPLGGEYAYRDMGRGGWHWTAEALADQPFPVQADASGPIPLLGSPTPSQKGPLSSKTLAGPGGEGPLPSQTVLPPPLDWFRGLEGSASWHAQELQIGISLLRQKEASSMRSAKPSSSTQ